MLFFNYWHTHSINKNAYAARGTCNSILLRAIYFITTGDLSLTGDISHRNENITYKYTDYKSSGPGG